ncbi:hypothetical protein KIN20_027953 [Parelaphostrongylus tenuis]|uniref:Uncharacterized protein n=1 Tax=Parelaphostrongylus tenuis TaxID=148309 RepID=A0AAD5WE82_PARTN|nr:hypothetical protein KIN20_027953 [Parelaphostrongylus tenuis]
MPATALINSDPQKVKSRIRHQEDDTLVCDQPRVVDEIYMMVKVLIRQQDRLWADDLSNSKKANFISKTRLVLAGYLLWMRKISKPPWMPSFHGALVIYIESMRSAAHLCEQVAPIQLVHKKPCQNQREAFAD